MAAEMHVGTFPEIVTRPLAQIIMLDAGHGDCNVIDLCLNAPIDGTNHGRPLYAYDRYVIDTGPPGDEYLTNLERVITTYKQPKLYGGAEPDGENAIVKMFQLTHTDNDHCGEAERLLNRIINNYNLRKHFLNTYVSFQQLPSQDPEFQLGLVIGKKRTIKCTPDNWEYWVDELKDFDMELRYRFTVGGVRDSSASPKSTRKLTAAEANVCPVQVKCAISLWGRLKPTRTTSQVTKFNMREYHRHLFRVKREFWIVLDSDEKRERAVAEIKRLIDVSFDNPVEPPDNTPKPDERKPADQIFHRIVRAMAKVIAICPGRLNGSVWRPEVGDKFPNDATPGRLSIVGPTKSLYNRYIKDSLEVEYHQSPRSSKQQAENSKADEKDSEIHNMVSTVSLFRRYTRPQGQRIVGVIEGPEDPIFTMLFTGDAHDRECSLRDTVDSYLNQEPQTIDVLKIPHHGSYRSTSAEFYQRIHARVYLICARQSFQGAPDFQILKAIVSQSSTNNQTAHIFFSNPNTLYDIKSGFPSNVNQLLDGPYAPGRQGPEGPYKYKCYILKWRLGAPATAPKNAGIILLGHDKDKNLIVTAEDEYWDIWDADRVRDQKFALFHIVR